MTKHTFVEAYLSGLFCNYICRCGFYFGPDGVLEAKRHFEAGHYEPTIAKAEGKEVQ